MSTTVADNAELHRFEISVDGELAGFAVYHDHAGRRTFTHTEIGDAYEGHGLGSTLIRHVLDDARARGVERLRVSRSARASIADHPDEYVALVPEPMRAKFDLARPA